MKPFQLTKIAISFHPLKPQVVLNNLIQFTSKRLEVVESHLQSLNKSEIMDQDC